MLTANVQNLLGIMSADDVVSNPSPTNANATAPIAPVAGTVPPQDPIAAITSHVRFPVLWRHLPQQWFTHGEAIFHTNRVRCDLKRVDYVLAALDEEDIRMRCVT